MSRYLLVIVCVAVLAGCGPDDSARWVDSEYRRAVARFEHDPDVLVWRGVLADRKHGFIDVLATAGAVLPGSPLDIIVAGPDSESASHLARSVARTEDIIAALEFIGMAPGHPIDVERLFYWPKGERVTVEFYSASAGSGIRPVAVPAGRFMHDSEANVMLAETSFRFVGPAGAAGALDVLTAFNAQNTILEVPYTTDRSTAQRRLTVGSDYQFEPGQHLRLRLRPEFRGDRKRVQNHKLDIHASNGGDRLSDVEVALLSESDEVLVDGGFEEVFVYLKASIADGKEPYLQLRFDDALSASMARDVARFTSQFLVEQQVRIEPRAGDPYISAFLPNEAWRDSARRNRSSQPLEIHLHGDGPGGILLQHQVSGEPRSFNFSDATELKQAIGQGADWNTDAVFLFTTPDTHYARIRNIHAWTYEQFPNFYVFL